RIAAGPDRRFDGRVGRAAGRRAPRADRALVGPRPGVAAGIDRRLPGRDRTAAVAPYGDIHRTASPGGGGGGRRRGCPASGRGRPVPQSPPGDPRAASPHGRRGGRCRIGPAAASTSACGTSRSSRGGAAAGRVLAAGAVIAPGTAGSAARGGPAPHARRTY